MTDAERFNYKCPYTDDPCFDFQCDGCPVEEEERRWTEELDKEEGRLHMDLISFRLKFNHLSQHLHFNNEEEVEILVDGKPIKDVIFHIYHGHGTIDFIPEGDDDGTGKTN